MNIQTLSFELKQILPNKQELNFAAYFGKNIFSMRMKSLPKKQTKKNVFYKEPHQSMPKIALEKHLADLIDVLKKLS